MSNICERLVASSFSSLLEQAGRGRPKADASEGRSPPMNGTTLLPASLQIESLFFILRLAFCDLSGPQLFDAVDGRWDFSGVQITGAALPVFVKQLER